MNSVKKEEICFDYCGSRGSNNGINTPTKRIITETEVTRDLTLNKKSMLSNNYKKPQNKTAPFCHVVVKDV